MQFSAWASLRIWLRTENSKKNSGHTEKLRIEISSGSGVIIRPLSLERVLQEFQGFLMGLHIFEGVPGRPWIPGAPDGPSHI